MPSRKISSNALILLLVLCVVFTGFIASELAHSALFENVSSDDLTQNTIVWAALSGLLGFSPAIAFFLLRKSGRL